MLLARKMEVLEFIDQRDIVSLVELMSWFGYKRKGAKQRIRRLARAGLIEPLASQRGRWLLSVKGINHLEFLRKRKEGAA